MTDAMLMFYPFTGIPTIYGTLAEDGECVSHNDVSLLIWFGGSDFIIGGYCLVAFILPFRKYIKLEQKQTESQPDDDKEGLSSIATRITLFSTIMITTTMLCTVIAASYSRAAGTLYHV